MEGFGAACPRALWIGAFALAVACDGPRIGEDVSGEASPADSAALAADRSAPATDPAAATPSADAPAPSPDLPAELRDGAASASLPPAALAELAPDLLEERALDEGVVYRKVLSGRGPWAIHLVSAELDRCELDLLVVPASGQDGGRVRTPTTEMAPDGSATPLAGVNGDFFRLDNGAPLGSEVTGTTRRFSTRPAMAWVRGREPWIGVPVRDGDRMGFGPDTVARDIGGDGRAAQAADAPAAEETSTDLDRHAPTDRLQVVGGFPELLDKGMVVSDLGVAERPAFAAVRHPRTAIGYDADAGLLWMVVVDGRQAPLSAGMTLPELASLLLWLGLDEALNLDGGGSSAMVLGGEVASSPSDSEGERAVGNSVWLVSDPEACASADP